MWLELANDGASDPKDQWIRNLYQRDFLVARDNDRLAAATMLDARVTGGVPPSSREKQCRIILGTV